MITGGTVSFEDGTKAKEEYGVNRKVRVELTFDDEATLERASELAKSQVYKMLDKRSEATSTAATSNPAPPTDLADMGAIEPPKRTRKPKVEPLPAAEPFHPAPAATEEKLDVPAGNTEAAPVLTDKQLYDFVVNTNAEIKKPDAIKDIIVKFSPAGKPPSTKLIPQDKRQAFIDEVKALAESVKK